MSLTIEVFFKLVVQAFLGYVLTVFKKLFKLNGQCLGVMPFNPFTTFCPLQTCFLKMLHAGFVPMSSGNFIPYLIEMASWCYFTPFEFAKFFSCHCILNYPCHFLIVFGFLIDSVIVQLFCLILQVAKDCIHIVQQSWGLGK